MLNDSYAALFNSILLRCQQKHWYGGEKNNTAHFREEGRRYETIVAPNGKEVVIDRDPEDNPLKSNFAYPPATEEQLLATEDLLGFPLPPLLRELYKQLANGGFGPGYGLIGVTGGFCEVGSIVDGYAFHVKRSELIDLEHFQNRGKPEDALKLPDRVWPRYFLYLCDWGLATTTCIDAHSGYIYDVYPDEQERYYNVQPVAPFLEGWLTLWLQDQLVDKNNETKNQRGDTPGNISLRQVFEG